MSSLHKNKNLFLYKCVPRIIHNKNNIIFHYYPILLWNLASICTIVIKNLNLRGATVSYNICDQ